MSVFSRFPERLQHAIAHELGFTSLRPVQELAGEAKRKLAREEHVRPLIDAFFEWVQQARLGQTGRNLATKALGYATNQEQELRRVLVDGRLPLDNTRAERSLRKVVVGRKNWMFYGSNSHAESAAAIFSLVASCRLHSIDPEQYFDEVMRALPDWPKGALP